MPHQVPAFICSAANFGEAMVGQASRLSVGLLTLKAVTGRACPGRDPGMPVPPKP